MDMIRVLCSKLALAISRLGSTSATLRWTQSWPPLWASSWRAPTVAIWPALTGVIWGDWLALPIRNLSDSRLAVLLRWVKILYAQAALARQAAALLEAVPVLAPSGPPRPTLGGRYHLHSVGGGVCVSGSDHRRLFPAGNRLG